MADTDKETVARTECEKLLKHNRLSRDAFEMNEMRLKAGMPVFCHDSDASRTLGLLQANGLTGLYENQNINSFLPRALGVIEICNDCPRDVAWSYNGKNALIYDKVPIMHEDLEYQTLTLRDNFNSYRNNPTWSKYESAMDSVFTNWRRCLKQPNGDNNITDVCNLNVSILIGSGFPCMCDGKNTSELLGIGDAPEDSLAPTDDFSLLAARTDELGLADEPPLAATSASLSRRDMMQMMRACA